MDKGNTVASSDGLPAVTKVDMRAPFRWLREGFGDLLKAPGPCLIYGLILALVSFGLTYFLVTSDADFWVLALTVGFVFVAPMLAMGLYEAGRQIEQGKKPSLGEMLYVREAVRVDVFYLGLFLTMIYLLWGRVAQIVYGLSTYKLHRTVDDFMNFALYTSEGHTMLITGTIVGAAFAFFTYCMVVISAPMLLDHRTNAFGATATSIRVVVENFWPMVLWAVILAGLTMATAVTGFLALAVVFPWLGLASWRAYRELVPNPVAS